MREGFLIYRWVNQFRIVQQIDIHLKWLTTYLNYSEAYYSIHKSITIFWVNKNTFFVQKWRFHNYSIYILLFNRANQSKFVTNISLLKSFQQLFNKSGSVQRDPHQDSCNMISTNFKIICVNLNVNKTILIENHAEFNLTSIPKSLFNRDQF